MSFCVRHILTYCQTRDFRLPAQSRDDDRRYGNVIGGRSAYRNLTSDDGDDIRFGLGRPFELSAAAGLLGQKETPVSVV